MLIAEDVWRWRPESDVLLVSVHWGSMYVDYPPPRVLDLAGKLAALPLDAVIGHHPHVVQGVRHFGAVPVLFSLGDAVFNARAGDFEATVSSARRRETGVFTLVLGSDARTVEYTPLWLDDDGIDRGFHVHALDRRGAPIRGGTGTIIRVTRRASITRLKLSLQHARRLIDRVDVRPP